MKKALFLAAVIGYFLVAICSFISISGFAYSDAEEPGRFIDSHFPVLVPVALSMGLGAFFAFTRIFPGKYKELLTKRSGTRIIMPLLFTILCFAFNVGILSGYNSMAGNSRICTISGIVTNKVITQKKSTEYFVWVRDSAGIGHKFEVTVIVYDRTLLNSHFSKQFNIGKLGFLYRKEE